MSKEVQDVVRTRKLELVDGEDRVRVSLQEHDRGFITMRFFDLSGHLKMNIGLGADGVPNVSLCHGDALPRIMMTAGNDGSSQIAVFAGDFENTKGTDRQRFDFYMQADGTGRLQFFADDGQPIVTLGMAQNNGALCFYKDGNVIWAQP